MSSINRAEISGKECIYLRNQIYKTKKGIFNLLKGKFQKIRSCLNSFLQFSAIKSPDILNSKPFLSFLFISKRTTLLIIIRYLNKSLLVKRKK